MSAPSAHLPGLPGRRILVTGGSRGIGRATARLLARAGASVGIAYRSAAGEADRAVEEAGSAAPEGRHWAAAADLAEPGGVRELFARVDEEWGGLEGFVGNAGIWNAEAKPLAELEPEDWDRMIATNLRSIYLTTREAVLRMEGGGRVVLVASTAAQRGEAEHSHYAASKGAVISFCKSIATELGPRSVNVNAVAPGWVETDMTVEALGPVARPRIEEDIPLGRVATPEDIAGPIAFLLSDLAGHVTGEVLNVNGGSVLCG